MGEKRKKKLEILLDERSRYYKSIRNFDRYLVGAAMANLGDELAKLGDEFNDLVITDSGSA